MVLNIIILLWEFPGGPVVRTQCFHCWAQVQSLVGKLRSSRLHGAVKTKQNKLCCFNFVLKYSWFTMMCSCQVCSLVIQWCVYSLYIYSFSDVFPLQVITRYWILFPVLYTKTLLFIYFIYCMHMLIPSS